MYPSKQVQRIIDQVITHLTKLNPKKVQTCPFKGIFFIPTKAVTLNLCYNIKMYLHFDFFMITATTINDKMGEE